MLRYVLGILLGSLLLLSSGQVLASESYHASVFVAPGESVPERPLTLSAGDLAAESGMVIDMSSGNAFGTWMLPLGGSYGLLPELEVGAQLRLLLRPLAFDGLFGMTRLYGRYLLLPDLMAAEVGLFVPTTSYSPFGFDLVTPLRYRVAPLDIFAQGRFGLLLGDIDYLDIGLSATALIDIPAQVGLFAFIDVALHFRRMSFDTAGVAFSDNDLQLPLGFGVGYRLLDSTLAKVGFRFLDLAMRDVAGSYRGLSARQLFFSVVHFVSLAAAD